MEKKFCGRTLYGMEIRVSIWKREKDYSFKHIYEVTEAVIFSVDRKWFMCGREVKFL